MINAVSRSAGLMLALMLATSVPAIFTHQVPPSTRYALVIGIAGYPYFDADHKLVWTDSDATAFAQFIQSPAGGSFPQTQVRLLRGREATRDAIFRQLDWIGQRANENDLVYVFFAGHGTEDPATHIAYLMPFDGDPSLPGSEGIPTEQFLEEVKKRLNARNIIFFIDACYAGSATTNSLTDRGGPLAFAQRLNEDWSRILNTQALNRMGFLSAGPTELSYESDSLRHGVFTWFLLKGLAGAADQFPHDNVVRAEELRRFLLDSVSSFVGVNRRIATPDRYPWLPRRFSTCRHSWRFKCVEG